MFLSTTIRIDSPVAPELVTHCLPSLTDDPLTLPGAAGLLSSGSQRYPIQLAVKA